MPSAAGAHHSGLAGSAVDESLRNIRPRIIPAHRKASHGNNGCVPLTNMSNSSPRGELVGGLVSHVVDRPSAARSQTHQWIPAPATAAATPMATSQGVASVNRNAAMTNIAP